MSVVNPYKSIIYSFLLFFLLYGCSQGPKYYREDCIVRINFDWTGMTPGEKYAALNSFAKIYPKAPKKSYNEIPPSSAVQGENDEYLYLQYKFDCENRIPNTEDLVAYVKTQIASSPNIEVDTGRFKPSIDTILSSGSNWIDSDPPIGEPIEIDGKKYIEVK